MDKVQKPDNPHKGHRNRMKEKYIDHGSEIFKDHELLEMLLYYAIPQQDTNPLAHRLLDRFGSIDGLLSARVEELTSVDGVKSSTAILISMINEFNRRRELEKASAPKSFDDPDEVSRYFISLFKGIHVERLYAIFLDNSLRIIDCSCISEGSVNATDANIRKICEKAFFTSAANVIIAHNHPNGKPIPSRADIDTTNDINSALSLLGIRLIEHYLVADDRCVDLLHRSCGY